MGYFMLDNKSSADFGVHVSGTGSWTTPSRTIETANVPGRMGALISYVGAWSNVTVTYPAWIARGFDNKFDAFCSWWNSHTDNYYILTDPYHPEYYRLARPVAAIDPKVGTLNRYGTFDLKFNCKPQKFLRDGLRPKRLTENHQILLTNPTGYDAFPLIVAKIRSSANSLLEITTDADIMASMVFKYTSSTYNYVGRDIEYDAETHEASCKFPLQTVSANNVVVEGLGSGINGIAIPANTAVFFESNAGDFDIYPRWYWI